MAASTTDAPAEMAGGCHCGAVRYRLARQPTYSMICHCRTCQGISGAPVMAWVSAPRADFQWTSGEPSRYASSPDVERRHCPACGTQLCYTRACEPTWIDVATASLDEPEACAPTHHSWLSHNILWVRFGDGLPTYPESRS